MSRWPGAYVIGLTGNIATGKSVVRAMLAELGALTLDADELAHEVVYKGGPAYAPVVETFGHSILGEQGEIDRARLGAIVFRDPAALERLEAIVHPAVAALIDERLSEVVRPAIKTGRLANSGRATKNGQPIVVVEAIKLIESGLADACDQIWVTSVPVERQLERLQRYRYLSEPDARLRIDAQPGPPAKLARADVVIDNDGTPEELRAQVAQAWRKLMSTAAVGA